MKNNRKMQKKYIKALSNIFYKLAPLTRDCNKLQTLDRQRKYIGVIFSGKHTLLKKLCDCSGLWHLQKLSQII